MTNLTDSYGKEDGDTMDNPINFQINQQTLTLPGGATIADALAAYGARPPYAVALNGAFVARSEHATRALAAGDKLDVVHPVAGG